MTRWLTRCIRKFGRNQAGTAMVEFAVVMLLFFLLFFSAIDFGRLGGTIVMIEKATNLAARTAIVRPPVCAGVPETNTRGTATTQPRMGTSCRINNGSGSTCANPGTFSCQGVATNAVAQEVWTRIQPLLPADVTIANLRFEYRFDDQLGFLGGPYTPMVTVEISPPDFVFVSPVAGLAASLGANTGGWNGTRPYRTFSVSLPAEDLAQGTAG